jgi:hypothetical protein
VALADHAYNPMVYLLNIFLADADRKKVDEHFVFREKKSSGYRKSKRWDIILAKRTWDSMFETERENQKKRNINRKWKKGKKTNKMQKMEKRNRMGKKVTC